MNAIRDCHITFTPGTAKQAVANHQLNAGEQQQVLARLRLVAQETTLLRNIAWKVNSYYLTRTGETILDQMLNMAPNQVTIQSVRVLMTPMNVYCNFQGGVYDTQPTFTGMLKMAYHITNGLYPF